MNFNDIQTFITSVGFPIACCIYLIYTQKETDKKNAETVDKLRETVNNNTMVMIQLCSKLGVDLPVSVKKGE